MLLLTKKARNMRQLLKKVWLITLSLTGLTVQTAIGIAFASWLAPIIMQDFVLMIALLILLILNLIRITGVILIYDLIRYDFFGIEEVKKLQAEGFQKNSNKKRNTNLFLIWGLVILDPAFGVLYLHQEYNILDGMWEILTKNQKVKSLLDFLVYWSFIVFDPVAVILYKRDGYHIYDGIPKKNWKMLFLSIFLNTLFIFLGVLGITKILFS